ncbi:hypothetical protein [Parapedobacter koreensis]|uniref:Uncharacterized protein n=1 Tax=Parapedobacter koreensis TaxID=332977 RepID=A0A1H7FX57_9SPHI|nr:hypothetical protein [Parapedobacter koreensis]SEK30374.1 hypothetical protein SAMN05421740_101487 [Parapedobacter koreensis]
MRTLMPYEQKWIAKRLKIYRIKYAELYNEIYDHLVSACEHKCRSGDNRPILSLFQETMDHDIGSHKGIARMTEERIALINSELRSVMKSHFIAYFASWKAAIPIGVFFISYFALSVLKPNLYWAYAATLMVLLLPFAYFALLGMQNRYFRTIRSRRKASLVNQTMFNLMGRPLSLFYAAFIGLPSLYDFFTGANSFYDTARTLIGFMGTFGMSLLISAAVIITIAVIQVVNTDYRRLIRELSHIS